MPTGHDSELLFSDAQAAEPASAAIESRWPVLVVDDDDQVHLITRYVLRDQLILGRGLQLESAYSAEQARQLLQSRRFACVLLDVVMESDDAGLQLTRYIREELGDTAVRIILRTGQPGFAPEMDVIAKYDINDYKAKAELTADQLVTALTGALRAYAQIEAVEASRLGLEAILRAAGRLNAITEPGQYALAALREICRLLRVEPGGTVCMRDTAQGCEAPCVLAIDRESFSRQSGAAVRLEPSLEQDIQTAIARQSSLFEDDRAAIFGRSPRGRMLVVWVAIDRQLSALDRTLVEVFAINLAAGFDNACLFEELESLAYRDRLTGLPNRLAFEREVLKQIAEHGAVSVAIADIDGFQAVNDGLGHDVGDQTLIAIAGLLQDVFGNETFIARNSGDNFAVLLPHLSETEIRRLLDALRDRAASNLQIEGSEIPLSISVGVAQFPRHGSSAAKLFQNAGIALKQAKRVSRSSYEFFDERLVGSLKSRLEIMRDLRYAVERDSLRLLYQPQINLRTGKIFGAEALVRWQRDAHGFVPAQEFIPAAEDSGHIVAIGEWVLREACRQHVRWRLEVGLDIQIAVNVSMRQLKDAGFIRMLERAILDTGIDPSRLEVEITESLMVENAGALVELLERVRSLGVTVAIDDFGTGYSSLSSLQKLPIDRLKIDRSFITGLAERKEDQIIAAMIVNMGHLLGLQVIAEGVEVLEQASLLVTMGCDDVQGYFYGRPMPANALLEQALKGHWRL